VLYTLQGHTSRVDSLAVVSDQHRIISASDDHTLKVWDLDSRKELLTFRGHTKPVRAVVAVPGGQYAISALG